MEKIKKKMELLLMLKGKFILFTIILFLSSCREQNIDEQIYQYIVKNCNFKNKDEYKIDLSEILQFKFDKAYLFGTYSKLSDIREIIGLDYYNSNLYGDNNNYVLIESELTKIIFIKNNKIIKELDFDNKKVVFRSDEELLKKHYKNYDTPFTVISNQIKVNKNDFIDQSTNKYIHEQE